jgi:hypothetical protein
VIDERPRLSWTLSLGRPAPENPRVGLDWEAFVAESRRRHELPLSALRTIAELRESLARIERRLVVEARRGGATWEEIGLSLGVSRQAAFARHRRFVKETDGDSPRPFA